VALLAREVTLVLRDGREAAIRSARPGDARALARLLDAVAAEAFVTLLMRPGEISAREWRRRIAAAAERETSLFLCAWLGGRLVGNLGLVADAHPASAHVRVLGMSVARDCRGLGLGGALLEAAIQWAADGGAEKIELSVFAHNAPALAFYERHGFVREGLRRRKFVRAGEYHDEVLMARFTGQES
jgi:RimJ/RimL family protein N-acetyltransferase